MVRGFLYHVSYTLQLTTEMHNMPHYEHDCTDCTFIATFEYLGEKMDAYVACDKSSHPFIARFGTWGEYMTVDVASPLYRIIRDLKDNPNTIVENLRSKLVDELETREQVLRDLGKTQMVITSVRREIAHWERKANA